MPDSGPNIEVCHRLSAILFADMVGFASLPQAAGLRQKEEMLALARECFAGRGGRLVKTLGDGFLAEFPAVTEAVRFAMDLQGRIARRNASVEARQRFRMRIGIHAGEVVVRGDDVEGSTVNVAARTEPLAAPGGICLTELVWQQAREMLPRPGDRLGRLSVKSIGRQFCFYHLPPEGTGLPGRVWLRARLFFNWPGRVPTSIVGLGVLLAVGVWLRPFAGELLDHLFPPTASRLVERAKQRLERYDQPGAVAKAIAELRQALVLDPGFTEAQATLGLAYWRQYKATDNLDDRYEASFQSSNVLARFDDSHLAQFVQGMVAFDEGRSDDATNLVAVTKHLVDASNHLVRASLAANWEDGEALVQLALTCRALKDPSSATNFERKALMVQRKPWYFFNALASYRNSLNDSLGAQTNLETALALAPHNPTLLGNLGQVIVLNLPTKGFSAADQRKAQRALACLRESLRLNPRAAAYAGLGLYYLRVTNHLAAGTNYLTAANLNPARYTLVGRAGLELVCVPGREPQGRIWLSNAVDKLTAKMRTGWTPVMWSDLGLYEAALGHDEETCRAFERNYQEGALDARSRSELIEAIERLRKQGHSSAADRLQRLLDRPR